MRWAHCIWLAPFFPLPISLSFLRVDLMPLLGASPCSTIFRRPSERCDPKRLNGQLSSYHALVYLFLLVFHRNTPSHPCSVSVLCPFSSYILSFTVKLAYLNTKSVAKHI
jgi:hypothetical protein